MTCVTKVHNAGHGRSNSFSQQTEKLFYSRTIPSATQQHGDLKYRPATIRVTTLSCPSLQDDLFRVGQDSNEGLIRELPSTRKLVTQQSTACNARFISASPLELAPQSSWQNPKSLQTAFAGGSTCLCVRYAASKSQERGSTLYSNPDAGFRELITSL